jgi:hypothetical protein
MYDRGIVDRRMNPVPKARVEPGPRRGWDPSLVFLFVVPILVICLRAGEAHISFVDTIFTEILFA